MHAARGNILVRGGFLAPAQSAYARAAELDANDAVPAIGAALGLGRSANERRSEYVSEAAMTLSKIYIIRHAEKPPSGPSVHLTERGVTRAAALSVMFDHARNGAYLPLDALYATAPSAHSRRAIETLQPLHAALPSLPFDTSFENGDERGLVAALKSSSYGVVLVAWHHEHIHRIVEELGVTGVPQWASDDVFDRVLTVDVGTTIASVSDSPQRLLFGDSTA